MAPNQKGLQIIPETKIRNKPWRKRLFPGGGTAGDDGAPRWNVMAVKDWGGGAFLVRSF